MMNEIQHYVYLADGKTKSYTVSEELDMTRVLIDGIALNENTDYSVQNSVISFDTPPRDNSIVTIMAQENIDKKLREEGIGYDVRYEHELRIKKDGIPYPMVEWCGKNCQKKWGWYFEHNSPAIDCPVMTFECEKDRFAFILRWGEA